MREEAAKDLAALDFPGYGIGGLAVGETPEERNLALDASIPHLPEERVRYVMGLGDTEGMLDAIARGVDLFDCVIPTRHARHGVLFTHAGQLSLRNARFRADDSPPDQACDCPACASHSRALLSHHFRVNESLGARLASLHNLRFYLRLMQRARQAIAEGHLASLREEVLRAAGERTG